MPSIALWTGLAKRIGVLPAYAAASFILGLGVMASVEWPSALGLLIAAAILGSALMGLTSLAFMAARQMVSGSPQRPIGLLTASFAVGQTLGPAVAGYMVDQLGSFRAPSLIAAGLLAFAALLALAAARLMRKKPEERMLPR
jgi:MFS family permease